MKIKKIRYLHLPNRYLLKNDKKMTKSRKYDRCQNMFGSLSPTIITRLDAFFNDPSENTWDDVHIIIIGIDGFTTFWQAVLAVNPSFPRSAEMDQDTFRTKWTRIPDFFTAKRALKYVAEIAKIRG